LAQVTFLALGYSVPVNPSKNRVYVWRKLREAGACYFRPGVAILPKSGQSLTQFRGLAARIRDTGGEAVLADLRFLDSHDEQRTIRMFSEQSREEYQELMADCASVIEKLKGSLEGQGPELVRKVMRRYKKIKGRDYFRHGPGGETSAILEELAEDIAFSAEELSRQLRAMLE
jgi:hypothetical protein